MKSRHRAWQKRRWAAGDCPQCGEPRDYAPAWACDRCLAKQREQARRYYHAHRDAIIAKRRAARLAKRQRRPEAA